jgi:hypothetical protein
MSRVSLYIIGASILIILSFSAIFIYPVAKQSFFYYTETKQTEKNLNEVKQKEKVLFSLSKNESLLKVVFNNANNFIPKSEQEGVLILELTAMAKQSNLNFSQSSVETSVKAKKTIDEEENGAKTPNKNTLPADEVKFNFSVSGNLSDFISFLKKVETSSRLISITDITTSQGKDGFTAQITGKAYFKEFNTKDIKTGSINISDEIMNKFKNLKTYSSAVNQNL